MQLAVGVVSQELQKDHHFVHVEVNVQVVVKRATHLFHGPLLDVDAILAAVVYQIGYSIEVVSGKAFVKVHSQETLVDTADVVLSSHPLQGCIGVFKGTSNCHVFECASVEVSSHWDAVLLNFIEDEVHHVEDIVFFVGLLVKQSHL